MPIVADMYPWFFLSQGSVEPLSDRELIISPQVHPKQIMGGCRRVLLPRGQLGAGLYLLGGRGRGVFIHSNRRNNSGLQTGDKITMVNV